MPFSFIETPPPNSDPEIVNSMHFTGKKMVEGVMPMMPEGSGIGILSIPIGMRREVDGASVAIDFYVTDGDDDISKTDLRKLVAQNPELEHIDVRRGALSLPKIRRAIENGEEFNMGSFWVSQKEGNSRRGVHVASVSLDIVGFNGNAFDCIVSTYEPRYYPSIPYTQAELND